MDELIKLVLMILFIIKLKKLIDAENKDKQ